MAENAEISFQDIFENETKRQRLLAYICFLAHEIIDKKKENATDDEINLLGLYRDLAHYIELDFQSKKSNVAIEKNLIEYYTNIPQDFNFDYSSLINKESNVNDYIGSNYADFKFRPAEYISIDSIYIGSASGDGSCFIHSLLANLSQEEFDKIKDYVTNDELGMECLDEVIENFNGGKFKASCNREQIIILRAAIAKCLKEHYANSYVFVTQSDTQCNIYEVVVGNKKRGYIDYESTVIEAVARITGRNVLCVHVNKDINNGYIYSKHNAGSIETDMYTVEIEGKHPSNDFILDIINNHKDTICIKHAGIHYEPFKANSMTDKNKFKEIKLDEVQINSLLRKDNLSKDTEEVNAQALVDEVTKNISISHENISFEKEEKEKVYVDVQTSQEYEFKNKKLDFFIDDKATDLEKFQLACWDNNGECSEELISKFNDMNVADESAIDMNIDYLKSSRNNNIILLVNQIDMSARIKSEAICFLLEVATIESKYSVEFLSNCNANFFESKNNIKVMSLIYRALMSCNKQFKDYSVVVYNKNVFNEFVKKLCNDESVLKRLELNPGYILKLIDNNRVAMIKHNRYKIKDEEYIDKNFDKKRCLISLYDFVDKILPVGCKEDFFYKFDSLDVSQKELCFEVLQKNEPKYVLPIIYSIVNENKDIIMLKDDKELANLLSYRKKLHINFLKNIGLQSSKNILGLSNFINLLSERQLKICADIINKSKKSKRNTNIAFLYELPLNIVGRILEIVDLCKIELKDLFKIYSNDKEKVSNELEKDLNDFAHTLQINEFRGAFSDNPKLFFTTFISTKRKIAEINFTEDLDKQAKEITEFAFNLRETKTERNQKNEKKSIDALKQYLIMKSFNENKNSTDLAAKIAKSVETAKKENSTDLADKIAESVKTAKKELMT